MIDDASGADFLLLHIIAKAIWRANDDQMGAEFVDDLMDTVDGNKWYYQEARQVVADLREAGLDLTDYAVKINAPLPEFSIVEREPRRSPFKTDEFYQSAGSARGIVMNDSDTVVGKANIFSEDEQATVADNPYFCGFNKAQAAYRDSLDEDESKLYGGNA